MKSGKNNAFFSILLVLSMLFLLPGCAIEITTTESSNSSSELTELTGDVPESDPVTIIDNENIFIEFRGFSTPFSGCQKIDFYMENKTNDQIWIDFRNDLVNGCSGCIANNFSIVPAHAKYLTSVGEDYEIFDDVLEKYDIDSIDTIQFDMVASYEMAGDPIANASVMIDLTGNTPKVTLDNP